MKIKSTLPVIDLKEPIKSTDFAALESIKNDRKTIGIKSSSDLQEMPRADEQGTLQKAMMEAAKHQAALTPSDWQWLKEAYKQAVFADELQRRAERQARLEEIRISDEEHARLLADLRLSRNLAANVAADRELYRVRGEQLVRADREWQEWIDKIDRKNLANKRELFELFMRALGYKLGYIRQAWNQKHLTEIQRSLTEIALNRQAENQRLHLQNMSDLEKMKQEMIRQTNNTTIDLLNEARISKLLHIREWRELTQAEHSQDIALLLLRAMGFKPGFLPLPSKQMELDEKVEKMARMRIEIEHNRKVDLEEFRVLLAELQSSALSLEHKDKHEKKITRRDSEREATENAEGKFLLAEASKERERAIMAVMGYKLDFIPLPWKRLEMEIKKESIAVLLKGDEEKSDSGQIKLNDKQSDTTATSDLKSMAASEEKSTASARLQSRQDSVGEKNNERPPQKAKLFKPAFSSIGINTADMKEQSDSLDRLAIDKKREQMESLEEINIKMSQMQAAAQLLTQTISPASEPNRAEHIKEDPVANIRQKTKAAK